MIDLFNFARKKQQMHGELHLADLPRMLNEAALDAPTPQPFYWTAVGEYTTEDKNSENSKHKRALGFLRITIKGSIWLECQRCLEPYQQPLSIDSGYRIVATDAEADAAPMDEAMHVVVGSDQFDLINLIEEELLLALPWIPKHFVCSTAHPSIIAAKGGNRSRLSKPEGEIHYPFAVLAPLRNSAEP